MNQATRDFIDSHLNDDVHTLSFLAEKYPDVDMQQAIRQITGKQKTRLKIPTFFACEDLLYPAKLSLEQSSSELTAKHKSAFCKGTTLIDLTGGFGVDSYFFSFGFEKVVYVEKQAELCTLVRHNFQALNRRNMDIIHDTAEFFLEKTDKVDWIYLDPARRTETGKKAVFLSDCEPNVAELSDKLLSKSDHVMIKLSPMIDIAILTKELKEISEIQIVAVENEVKEVIAVLHKQTTGRIQIQTTNYSKNSAAERFDFFLSDESSAEVAFAGFPQTYLYEPNAAIMKSGAFRSVSEHFSIEKLHTNSHLYTSTLLIHDFPGRIFKVEKTYDFSKGSLKEFHSEVQKANLSTRNFPLHVSELRKKLKLAEGGDVFIFATTLNNGKKVLIHTEKV